MISACQCLGFLPLISICFLLSLLWVELGRGGSPSNLRRSLITAVTLFWHEHPIVFPMITRDACFASLSWSHLDVLMNICSE